MRILNIGDLHYGEHGNSQKYNEQVNEFIDYICENYVGVVDKVVQVGDWFHHRNKIQVDTLSYAIVGAKKLEAAFGKENVYVLSGNHDLFYLNRLDVSSLAAIDPYVTVVDDLTTIGTDVLLTPWIATDEMWESVVEASQNHKTVIGHFEFSAFKMNEHYVMESGRSHKELKDYTRVISGHYHTRQEKDNVTYVGTPYPITFSEANQKHGVYILDTATDELKFEEYSKIKVISIPYDQLDTIIDYDRANTRIRIEFPSDLDDESIIGDVVAKVSEMGFEGVRTQYAGKKLEKLLETSVEIADVDNIDENILEAISQIDTDGINKEILGDIYKLAVEAANNE